MNLYTTIGEGLPVAVSFDHLPGCEAQYSWGDGYGCHPAEPPTVDITEITVVTGECCIHDALNQKTLDRIEAECFKQVGDDKEAYEDAKAEAQHEAQIDRIENERRG